MTGRHRTLGGGYLVVQAMAGLARAGAGTAPLAEARELFARHDRFDFSHLWPCMDGPTLLELGRAALAVGDADARALIERAEAAGCVEARRLLDRVPAFTIVSAEPSKLSHRTRRKREKAHGTTPQSTD